MSTVTVSNSAGLSAALSAAHAGDTILLSAGKYDSLALKNLSFATEVTITSADLNHEAELSNFSVTNVTGLAFTQLDMLATGGLDGFAFNIKNSSGIRFDSVSVHGSLDGNAQNDANGISVLNSTKISVTNSEFQQLGRAVAVGTASNVAITGNIIHDIRTDGLDFAQVDHVTISGNVISNFRPLAADHPDAIQFWTTGTTAASHDITIKGNVIAVGNGDSAQGIFLRDQLGTLAYQNVTITDNLVAGTGSNGIRVIGVSGLVISGNELTTNSGSMGQTNILIESADHVTASNNQASAINYGTGPNVTQAGDKLLVVQTDGGRGVLDNWLHTHGLDGQLADLTTTVQAVDGAALATLGKVAGVAAGTQTLAAGTLNLTLKSGLADIDGTGNALNNVLTGNAGDNHLYGAAGNDTLDGGSGADTLVGGIGDDTYYCDSGDAVREAAGQGIDTVIVRGNYTLPDDVENLTINSAATNGWSAAGNALDNVIMGNAGGNLLDGGAGNDTIDGGVGLDTLIGGTGNDRLTGGLTGGDVFRFGPSSGKDIITDFGHHAQRDVLDISGYKAMGVSANLHEVGGNAVISFATGDQITLLGVHANELMATATGWIL